MINHRKNWMPFEDAREYIRALKLENTSQWNAYCKTKQKPENIPVHPERIYHDQFQDWSDWLGTNTIAPQNREYLPFETARTYARSLHLKSWREWRIHCTSGQKPENIPSDPKKVYKTQFEGYSDWIGTANAKKQDILLHFLVKVTVLPDGCWFWTGSKNKKQYGHFSDEQGKIQQAHRWSYEYFVEPIPDGLQIDHLCRNHACVHPEHLEPVTNKENSRRGLKGVLFEKLKAKKEAKEKREATA